MEAQRPMVDEGRGKPVAFTRSKPRDTSKTERMHFEGALDDRLILHHATPAKTQALQEAFGMTEIPRSTYERRERVAMGATSEDEGPARGQNVADEVHPPPETCAALYGS